MPNMNRVILAGNLTDDPEVRQTTHKSYVCNAGLALNRSYATPDGTRKQETTFVDLEAWGNQAQTIGRYLHRGDPILIEGRLKQDRWQDKEGKNRSRIKIVVEQFQFVSGDRGADKEAGQARKPVAQGAGA